MCMTDRISLASVRKTAGLGCVKLFYVDKLLVTGEYIAQ